MVLTTATPCPAGSTPTVKWAIDTSISGDPHLPATTFTVPAYTLPTLGNTGRSGTSPATDVINYDTTLPICCSNSVSASHLPCRTSPCNLVTDEHCPPGQLQGTDYCDTLPCWTDSDHKVGNRHLHFGGPTPTDIDLGTCLHTTYKVGNSHLQFGGPTTHGSHDPTGHSGHTDHAVYCLGCPFSPRRFNDMTDDEVDDALVLGSHFSPSCSAYLPCWEYVRLWYRLQLLCSGVSFQPQPSRPLAMRQGSLRPSGQQTPPARGTHSSKRPHRRDVTRGYQSGQ